MYHKRKSNWNTAQVEETQSKIIYNMSKDLNIVHELERPESTKKKPAKTHQAWTFIPASFTFLLPDPANSWSLLRSSDACVELFIQDVGISFWKEKSRFISVRLFFLQKDSRRFFSFPKNDNVQLSWGISSKPRLRDNHKKSLFDPKNAAAASVSWPYRKTSAADSS